MSRRLRSRVWLGVFVAGAVLSLLAAAMWAYHAWHVAPRLSFGPPATGWMRLSGGPFEVGLGTARGGTTALVATYSSDALVSPYASPVSRRSGGWGFGRNEVIYSLVKRSSTGHVWVSAPMWAVWPMLAAATVVACAMWRRVARDAFECRCTVCDYDLRATPDRCPECGSTPQTGSGRSGVQRVGFGATVARSAWARRSLRWVLRAVMAVSLALAVLLAAGWVRTGSLLSGTQSAAHGPRWTGSAPLADFAELADGRWSYKLFSLDGTVVVTVSEYDAGYRTGWRWQRLPGDPAEPGFAFAETRGFATGALAFSGGGGMVLTRAVSVPYWALMIVVCGAAALAWRSGRWMPSAFGAECCRACGYDLRATPDRCPECGAVGG